LKIDTLSRFIAEEDWYNLWYTLRGLRFIASSADSKAMASTWQVSGACRCVHHPVDDIVARCMKDASVEGISDDLRFYTTFNALLALANTALHASG
jgi:hypothetical protein